MIDPFIFLAPILLLVVVALLGFAGCKFHPGAVAESITITPASGSVAGGTSISITGTNTSFAAPATVNFGTLPNTINATATNVIVLSQTMLTANTPPSPSPGDVEVWVTYSVSGGTDTTPSASYTYFKAPVILAAESALDIQGGKSVQVNLNFTGQKLVVVTLLWGGTTLAANPVNAPGVTFTQLHTTSGQGLNPQQVAVYHANNVTGPITITASLSGNSSVDFIVAASAYDNATTPDTSSILQTTLPFVASPAVSFPVTNLAAGDLIYAVVVGRNNASSLTGNLAPAGLGLVSEGANIPGFLVEDYSLQAADISSATPIALSAADSSGTATRWYTFAIRIPHV